MTSASTYRSGEYVSRELDVTYLVRVRDTGLILVAPGRKAIALEPIFPEAFHAELVDVVEFSRDARRAVSGFTVNTDGVRRLRLDRVAHLLRHFAIRPFSL